MANVKPEGESKASSKPEETGEKMRAETSPPVVFCKHWREFKEKSRGAEVVAFEWTEGEGLTIKALSKQTVYKYILEGEGLKSWLSHILDVPEARIVEGEMYFPWARKTGK